MIEFSYDPEADAAYIRLARAADHRGLKRTVVTDVELDRAAINLDLATDDVLLGIEVLGASRVLAMELLERTSE
jgi:uncharacterized protein YuzE